jgi:hypothetical protein
MVGPGYQTADGATLNFCILFSFDQHWARQILPADYHPSAGRGDDVEG